MRTPCLPFLGASSVCPGSEPASCVHLDTSEAGSTALHEVLALLGTVSQGSGGVELQHQICSTLFQAFSYLTCSGIG